MNKPGDDVYIDLKSMCHQFFPVISVIARALIILLYNAVSDGHADFQFDSNLL